MMIDTMFECHLSGYLSIGNEFHCVRVIVMYFLLVDSMFGIPIVWVLEYW